MTTSLVQDTHLSLTADDRVLLHAIAMAGDAVREADVAYLLQRWPWATPMDWDRVDELEAAGMLHRTDDGWFVPLSVDVDASAKLPKSLDPLLKGLVGEMLCRHADSFDRFRLGFRRMIAGGHEDGLVSASRVWAVKPAAIQGPRGARFVEAIGGKGFGPELRARLRDAVPEVRPARFERMAAAAAAVMFVVLEVLGRTAPMLKELE